MAKRTTTNQAAKKTTTKVAKKSATAARTRRKPSRTFDALPDTVDFRDLMFVPTLVEVPTEIPLAEYKKKRVPILDQGREGACTGFALATVVNCLLRTRRVVPDPEQVSPRMLYEMAKRYDEWPGEAYEGSSARGAMKGWHKHGVCGEADWPYALSAANAASRRLTNERASAAARRPLGAYFRVNHKDLVAMHAAIAEAPILYATATVHDGWDRVERDGSIPFTDEPLGGHAFAIVAYDAEGLWIQNSWGPEWGVGGFARISYDDWLVNANDVWVARLGAPVVLNRAASHAVGRSAGAAESAAYTFCKLRPHIVSIGNNGAMREGGTFGTSAEDVKAIFSDDFPRVTKDWKTKRILLYAHGGLTSESSAVQRLADLRATLLESQVYPVAFIWKTDFWSTVTNILSDAMRRRRPEGFLDSAKDFMLDRLDDALEPIARLLGGRVMWEEMKQNAEDATLAGNGGARLVADEVKKLSSGGAEVHLAGHSAGSILLGPVLQRLTTGANKTRVASCTLWAPAATVEFFKKYYLPAIKSNAVGDFGLFTLDDHAERGDHCANIYRKSLLYLVANAFEDRARIPLVRDGVPIVGMEKFVRKDAELAALWKRKNADWVLAPSATPTGSRDASQSLRHGDFDDDGATLQATLARILARKSADALFNFQRSQSSAAAVRARL